MKARTHDLASITGLTVVTIVVAPTLPPMSLATMLVALLANQLGGIAPDIDQPTAPFWRNVSFGRLFGPAATRLLGGHRFLTHSLVGVWLAGLLVTLVLQTIHPIIPHVDTTIVWWAFMIGMVSHLVMDSFTKEGVPWLLPLPIKFGFPPLKKFRVTTGKAIENFVIFPLLAIGLIIVCTTYYPQLYELFQNRITR